MTLLSFDDHLQPVHLVTDYHSDVNSFNNIAYVAPYHVAFAKEFA